MRYWSGVQWFRLVDGNASTQHINLIPRFSASIYTEQRGDRVLILDPSQPTWIVTNENSANLLCLFDGHKSIGDVLSIVGSSQSPQYLSAYGVIARALELGVLWVDKAPDSRARRKTLSSVHLTLTRKCNLQCIYCYADAGKPNQHELSTETWEDITSQIYSLSGPVNFVLTGGEPTLFGNLEQLANHIRSLDCTVQLITNGSWGKHLNVDLISRLFTQIIVSIDGSSPEINDLHRGVGTFKKALNTVTLLQEHGANVQVAVVVTKINAGDICSIRSLFEPMGVSVKFQPVYFLGRGAVRHDILIDGEGYFNALMVANEDNTLSLFDRPLEPGVKSFSCGVGGGTLSIDSDGSVYPCHLLHEQEYSLGQITDNSFADIWERLKTTHWHKISVDEIEVCRDCVIRYICAGQCRARALAQTGNLYSPDPFCTYFKQATLEFLFNVGKWTKGSNAKIEKDTHN